MNIQTSVLGVAMDNRFDIFWFGEGGPTWVDTVATLESAKDRIATLPQKGSLGSYAVRDLRTGNRITFAPSVKIPATNKI